MLDEKMLKIYGSVDVKGAGTCPTVEIASPESPSGRVVINKSDYDASTMELYVEAVGKGQQGNQVPRRNLICQNAAG